MTPVAEASLSQKSDREPQKPGTSKSKAVVADSWEDDDSESGDQVPVLPATTSSPPSTTPLSSTFTAAASAWSPDPYPTGDDPASGESTPSRRPEKTDAVARRMIVAGLGLKAPKQTDEQKAYQKSIREQEKKRRELEKLHEQRQREADERAKAAMWDD